MTNHTPIRPEDILPDHHDYAPINGRLIRKGTIAAFIANTEILENPMTTEQQKYDALNSMKKLAPDVVAIGLHKHVIFKNQQAEQLLSEAAALIHS